MISSGTQAEFLLFFSYAASAIVGLSALLTRE